MWSIIRDKNKFLNYCLQEINSKQRDGISNEYRPSEKRIKTCFGALNASPVWQSEQQLLPRTGSKLSLGSQGVMGFCKRYIFTYYSRLIKTRELNWTGQLNYRPSSDGLMAAREAETETSNVARRGKTVRLGIKFPGERRPSIIYPQWNGNGRGNRKKSLVGILRRKGANSQHFSSTCSQCPGRSKTWVLHKWSSWAKHGNSWKYFNAE